MQPPPPAAGAVVGTSPLGLYVRCDVVGIGCWSHVPPTSANLTHRYIYTNTRIQPPSLLACLCRLLLSSPSSSSSRLPTKEREEAAGQLRGVLVDLLQFRLPEGIPDAPQRLRLLRVVARFAGGLGACYVCVYVGIGGRSSIDVCLCTYLCKRIDSPSPTCNDTPIQNTPGSEPELREQMAMDLAHFLAKELVVRFVYVCFMYIAFCMVCMSVAYMDMRARRRAHTTGGRPFTQTQNTNRKPPPRRLPSTPTRTGPSAGAKSTTSRPRSDGRRRR